MDRRSFIAASGFASLYATGCGGLSRLPTDLAPPPAGLGEGGYGHLYPAGPELLLPQGFQYRALGRQGAPMSDGRLTPAAHDGMCALPLPNANIRLIRNHEVSERPEGEEPTARAYDPKAGGGTTSLEIDPVTREIVRDFVSLDGTVRNCAGGPTPWGSWLSCEETVAGETEGLMAHGYVFEVPSAAEETVEPVRLPAMGRFVHEAVAVDPATGIVYETEDSTRAGLYCFIPNVPGDLAAGGRLEMLAVHDEPNFDTATGQTVGRVREANWVPIADPDPSTANQNASAVFDQGWNLGAARFQRLEGAWSGAGSIYFNATSGGDDMSGQVWRYRPTSDHRGLLTLVYESPGRHVLNHPDNICVSPRGGLVLCEDGGGSQFVRGLTLEGRIFDVVQNPVNEGEFAGATFSPDGRTLFVNTQGFSVEQPGITFAIWGPWEQGAL
jgi:secreted PhoX family phosphatase